MLETAPTPAPDTDNNQPTKKRNIDKLLDKQKRYLEKAQKKVDEYDQDIIKAFGGVLALASFPEVNGHENHKEILGDLDKIAVRGKDENGSYVKILKKSERKGYVDDKMLFSKPKEQFLKKLEKDALNKGHEVVVTSNCLIWGHKYKKNGDNINNRNSRYMGKYEVARFAEKAYKANELKTIRPDLPKTEEIVVVRNSKEEVKSTNLLR